MKSQRGVLLLFAVAAYLAMFLIAVSGMAVASTQDAVAQIRDFVSTPQVLFGTLITIGFGFYFKDKATEKAESALAASRERIALSATPLGGYVATFEGAVPGDLPKVPESPDAYTKE